MICHHCSCILANSYWHDVLEDNPPGHFIQVVMFKDNVNMCKQCFYIKRGSLNNMPLHELVKHLSENPDFADKPLC